VDYKFIFDLISYQTKHVFYAQNCISIIFFNKLHFYYIRIFTHLLLLILEVLRNDLIK